MEKDYKLLLLAQDVSIAEESEANPVFMQIRMRVCNSSGNLNGQGVTPSFISSIVNHGDVYNAVPLYCDVENLLAKNYRDLGHMYTNGKFYSTQIGALTGFYSETDDDGVTSLYATARVPRRESEICECLQELYANGDLSFSFEVKYSRAAVIVKNGVQYITDHPDSALVGVAVVSVPAYEDAVALDLVASKNTDVSEEIVTEGGEPKERGELEQMNDEMKMTAEATEETVVAEEQTEETVAETVDETSVAEAEETVVAEDAEDKPEDEDEKEEEVVAEVQEDVASAEVIEDSVVVRESIETYGEDTYYTQEVVQRYVERISEQETTIAELNTQIAQLKEIEEKYNAIIAEKEAQELEHKRVQARAFAEKQGLDTNNEDVAKAIQDLDYTAIAELTMAQVQDEEEAHDESVVPTITLASFVEMEVGENNAYGGLLKPRSK